MSALDRELLVLHGLTTCRRDAEKVAEAVAELAALRAELEQCRADADRYRWLQQNYAIGDGYVYVDEALNNGEADTQLSAAIDEARGRQMTQHINDGGPAFPVQDAATWQGHGMTLRDYFAAGVLQGAISSGRTNLDLLERRAEEMARSAYQMADAMLSERENRGAK